MNRQFSMCEATASALPGNLLKMQILRPHPRPTEAETLGMDPTLYSLTSFPADFDRQ